MRSYIECDGGVMNFWERESYNQSTSSEKSQKGANARNSNWQNTQTNANQSQSARTQAFEDVYGKYAGQSEDELMSELLKVATQMKGEGTFDAQALENLYENAKPYLNSAQLAKMRSLINMLKGSGNG